MVLDIDVNGSALRRAFAGVHPFWGVGVGEVVDDVLAAVFVGAGAGAASKAVGHGVGIAVLGHVGLLV